MQNMIREYENARVKLLDRIHTLNHQLRAPSLMTREREQLEQRREILTYETIELLHVIADLREHQDTSSH